MRSNQRRLAFAAISVLALVLFACRASLVSPPSGEGSIPPPANTPSATYALTSSAPIFTQKPTATPEVPTITPTPIVIGEGPAEIPFVIPLTVQHVGPTQATVFFELESPSPGALIYGPLDPGFGAQAWIPLDPTTARHQIDLEGLSPGVGYQVFVALGPGLENLKLPQFFGGGWGPVRFTTQALEASVLRVGVIGDSGFGQEVTYSLVEAMSRQDLDFVLHVGDLVYRMWEQDSPLEAFARKFYAPFAPLLVQMPVYPVVGNHDVEKATLFDGVPFYYHAFPPVLVPGFPPSDRQGQNAWYAFAYGDVQFLMLDSQVFFNEQGVEAQTAWLVERLADERFRLSIPAFHVAPYTSGLHMTDGAPIRRSWLPLFEAANVPLVLSGHDHLYERLEIAGITYIVTGGGTTVLYPESGRLSGSQAFAMRTHFVILEIRGDRITISAVGLDGEIFDQVDLWILKAEAP